MTTIVYNDDCLKQRVFFGHPEQEARYTLIKQSLEQNFSKSCRWHSAKKATIQDLLLCHTKDYIDLVQQEILSLGDQLTMLSTGDVIICHESFEAALASCGVAIEAVRHVMQNQGTHAFCINRPPGHHAESNRGMGFCLFNNIAIAAHVAKQEFEVKRIAICDFDVHHGNGTQEITFDDPEIYYFSLHQEGIYPFTGLREETGGKNAPRSNLNVPIQAGVSSRSQFRVALKLFGKKMETFQPELLFLSCGLDAHKDDPIGGLSLEDEDYLWAMQLLLELTENHCKRGLVSVLEGGYNLDALQRVSVKMVDALTQNR